MASYHNPTAADVAALFSKFDNQDSDIRYMTLVDLNKLLTEGAPSFLLREKSTCNRVVDHLIKLLDDPNGDVQSQALKCIGPFSAKVPSELLVPFMEKIVNLRTQKSQDTSIPATAARTLILSFPRPIAGSVPSKPIQDAYSTVSRVLIPKLLGFYVIDRDPKAGKRTNPGLGMLNVDSPKGADIEAIDLLSDVIRCFGVMLQEPEIQALQQKLTEILEDSKTGPIAKKRAVASMSTLSYYMPDTLLSSFVSSMIESFRSAHLTPTKRRLLISLMGAVARAIPRRFGPYLQTMAPFVLSAVSQRELEESMEAMSEDNLDASAEEAKEAAFMALNDFVSCCPNEMIAFTKEIVESGLRYITYDPAVITNEEEDGDEMGDSEEVDFDEDDEDYEQEESLDDDENSSWKIRRCASRMIYNLISTRGNELIDEGVVYERITPVLVKSFKEREESVRLEILATITLIIRKTAEAVAPISLVTNGPTVSLPIQGPNPRKRRRGDSNAHELEEQVSSQGFASPTSLPSPTSTTRSELLRLGPSILTGAVKLLNQKLIPTKQATITLLKTYVQLKRDSLTDYLGKVLEPVVDCIKISPTQVGAQALVSSSTGSAATGTTLRIESLQFLSILFDTHSSKSAAPYLDRVIQGLLQAVNDKYFKIACEALGSSESVIQALTPPRAFGYDKSSGKYVETMFDMVLTKAKSNDVDVEVRQRAIHALGICLARTADARQHIPARKRKDALLFLRDRLKGEMTRVASIGAVDMILASSTNAQDFDLAWIREITAELANQLRKADRRLRGSSLSAIRRLAGNATASSGIDTETLKLLTSQLLLLFSADNFQHLGIVVSVLTGLVQKAPQVIVTEEVNSRICQVVVEPLSGHILDAFLGLIEAIGKQGVGASLMTDLLQKVGVNGDPSIVGTVVGTLLATGGSSLPISTNHILNELNTKQDDQRVSLALFILGEVGLRQGLSSNVQPKVYLDFLQSKSDLVQRAAAVGLGRAGAANTGSFLPVILEATENTGNLQSLILYSIKELLQQSSRVSVDVASYSEAIWNSLIKLSGSTDNKAVGAECVGRLAATEPLKYLPLLQNYLSDPMPSVRGMVIQAIRFALGDSDEAMDDALKPSLMKMLTVMLKDSDLENRRLAMTTVYSAARHKPTMILPNLSQLLPYVIRAAEIDPSLIREIQMGPFRHKVDDGLETRKGAYETLHALLSIAYGRMNHIEVFDRVLAGLQDEHDVRMLSMLMLSKLINIDPDETARRLDALAEPFQKIVSTKPKESAVKQEVEKLQEAVKDSFILTVRLRSRFPETSASSTNPQGQAWKSYLEYVKKDCSSQLQSAEAEIKSQS